MITSNLLSFTKHLVWEIPQTSLDYMSEILENSSLDRDTHFNIDEKTYIPILICNFCLKYKNKIDKKNYKEILNLLQKKNTQI